MSLSHLQRDLVAQEVGIMHQVSYSSSVSTFCQNEIKDRNYKTVQQHIIFSRENVQQRFSVERLKPLATRWVPVGGVDESVEGVGKAVGFFFFTR